MADHKNLSCKYLGKASILWTFTASEFIQKSGLTIFVARNPRWSLQHIPHLCYCAEVSSPLPAFSFFPHTMKIIATSKNNCCSSSRCSFFLFCNFTTRQKVKASQPQVSTAALLELKLSCSEFSQPIMGILGFERS